MAIELQIDSITDDKLLAISQSNPGYRFERSAGGKLLVSPTSLLPSGGEGELYLQVALWTKKTKLGRAFPATGGFTLADTGIKAADTSYFTNDRLLSNVDDSNAFPHMVPNVTFELMSPDDTVRETKAKIQNYIDNGCDLGVIVDPKTSEVMLLRPGSDWIIHTLPTVEIGSEMPGFLLDVAEIIYAQRKGI